VIDAAAGEVDAHYLMIREELTRYGAGLDRLSEVAVLNKIDLLAEPPGLGAGRPERVFRLSCATGEGIEEFRRALFSLVPPAAETAPTEPDLADFLVYRPKPRRPAFRILRTDRGYRVVGTPPGREELEEALRLVGARAGQEIEVGDETLEYR
jgi:hypothetical protein